MFQQIKSYILGPPLRKICCDRSAPLTAFVPTERCSNSDGTDGRGGTSTCSVMHDIGTGLDIATRRHCDVIPLAVAT